MKKANSKKMTTAIVAVSVVLMPNLLAAGGGGMPWEGPLQQIVDSLTGPVAFSIGALAFFVAGGMLIFGSEIGDFTKRVLFGVLAASLMILGPNLLQVLFGGGTTI